MFRTLYCTRPIYGMGDISTYTYIRCTAPYSAARETTLVWGSLTLAQIHIPASLKHLLTVFSAAHAYSHLNTWCAGSVCSACVCAFLNLSTQCCTCVYFYMLRSLLHCSLRVVCICASQAHPTMSTTVHMLFNSTSADRLGHAVQTHKCS